MDRAGRRILLLYPISFMIIVLVVITVALNFQVGLILIKSTYFD